MANRRIVLRVWQYIAALGRPGPDLSRVTDLLAVSGTVRLRDYDWLARRHFRAVVDLRAEARGDQKLLAKRGIDFLHLPVEDHFPPSQEQLEQGSEWVLRHLEDGHRTIVHCKEGIGRSIGLACCVLLRMGYSLSGALDLLKRRRWGVALNALQMKSLYDFERRLRDGNVTG